MRRGSQSLADVREDLAQIQGEFTNLQERIDATGEKLADRLTRSFGEQRPTLAGLDEEELATRIADRVIARLNVALKFQSTEEKKYLRERKAAKLLRVSQHTLRAGRSRGSPTDPPYARFGRVLLYPTKELERFFGRTNCQSNPGQQ